MNEIYSRNNIMGYFFFCIVCLDQNFLMILFDFLSQQLNDIGILFNIDLYIYIYILCLA